LEMAEASGPCPCGGSVCKNGFGWVFGKIHDLSGNIHSGRYDVKVCSLFPLDLLIWDVEDEIALPPPPPGLNIETLKGFMGKFRGTEKDLQRGDSGISTSEREFEKIAKDSLRAAEKKFEGGWQDGNI